MAADPVFEVIEGAAVAELHAEACRICAGKGWYFGHGGHDQDFVRFWRMDLDGNTTFDAIWEHIRPRCEMLAGARLRVVRQYASGHTYGLGGQAHVDEVRPGCFTLLYYAMREWLDGWEGETVFHGDEGEVAASVVPRPNRAVFFDSRIPHGGRPPARLCPALRVTVAYKLEIVTPEIEQIQSDGAQRVYRVRIQAKSEIAQRLVVEAADSLLRQGGLPVAVEMVEPARPGDVEFRLTVVHLPDLPAPDFSSWELERLYAAEEELSAAGITAEAARELFEEHLHQQLFDYLDTAYSFSIAPVMVDRELAAIWPAAEAELKASGADAAARETAAGELRVIAERRVRLGAVLAELARRYKILQASTRLTEAKVLARLLEQARISDRAVTASEILALQ